MTISRQARVNLATAGVTVGINAVGLLGLWHAWVGTHALAVVASGLTVRSLLALRACALFGAQEKRVAVPEYVGS
jgi:hypothetical protein